MSALEVCVGCGAVLPALEGGPTHRYMESSAACWAAFAALDSPECVFEPTPWSSLIVDTYAAQHPGRPNPQAINSVAIHLMTLYGVLERGFSPGQALWLRTRPGRPSRLPKHQRFHWLTPPSFASSRSVTDVMALESPHERSRGLECWVREVWAAWAAPHEAQVAAWFETYVLAERL